ncbi:helix-turn-helix transcriptional regulator [Roseibium sp. SCPC15]|uniref:helix-turn-helix transcriptional regulator n=1 Tax=Roseibium sp. SCP15 TaxID=3141376 RepID=UPI00333AAC30
MISIPVSFLLAAIFFCLGLAVLMWKRLPLLSRQLFLALFCLMAFEAVLVGMRFALGSLEFLAVQRVLPVWIAPAAYLSFAVMTVPEKKAHRLIILNGTIAVLLSGAMFLPVGFIGFIDVLIAASFAAYSALLFRQWRLGPDQFSEAPTNLHELLRKLSGLTVLVLAATLLIDAIIAFLFAREMTDAAAKTISVASLLFLIVAFALVFISLKGNARTANRPETSTEEDLEKQRELVAKAHTILIDKAHYRDPGLTLTRLARRVGVPDRDLSRAINQQTGENVSQFVNQIRLSEAARFLSTTDDPVTNIQEQVGFLTRSNFYKEFQKRFGVTPGAYRKAAQSSPLSTSR